MKSFIWMVPAFALAVSGCGSRGNGTVSGTVTVSGEPLVAGLITFVGEEEPFATESAGIRQGRYETAAMPAGRYTVLVKAIDANAAANAKPAQDLMPGAVGKPKKNRPPHSNYEDPALSGLNFTVSAGKCDGPFNLEPQP